MIPHNNVYLGVNPDGTEVCSNYRMFRFTDGLNRLIEMKESYKIYSDRENRWCDTYSDGYFTIPKFDGVYLPKGTIKTLTGKDITWEDEPITISIK